MSEPFKSILEWSEYDIHFQENGIAQGYWFLFERIKHDFEAKQQAGVASKGYLSKVIWLSRLNALNDSLVMRNLPIEAMIAQYEGALVMQYIAHHILKDKKTGKPLFTVTITKDGHSEANELKPSDVETEKDKTPTPTLALVGLPEKGS